MMEESHILKLNFDCVERILKLIDLESLCNVAKTCKQLKTAAEIVFSLKYAKSSNRLYNEVQYRSDNPKWERILESFAHLIQSVFLPDDIINTTATSFEKMNQKMPLMKDISFNLCEGMGMFIDIKNILSFCPNVERLEVYRRFSTAQACELFALLSEKLKVLLWICVRTEENINNEFIDILCNFKHLKMLELPFKPKVMTLLFNSLASKDVPIEELYLSDHNLDDDFIDSVCKFKIQKLGYRINTQYGYTRFVRLVQRLPHLTELGVASFSEEVDLLDFLQKILPLTETLAQFNILPYHKHNHNFEIGTYYYESLVNIVKRRASDVKLKINFKRNDFTINVHPDILRQNDRYVEIKNNYQWDLIIFYDN